MATVIYAVRFLYFSVSQFLVIPVLMTLRTAGARDPCWGCDVEIGLNMYVRGLLMSSSVLWSGNLQTGYLLEWSVFVTLVSQLFTSRAASGLSLVFGVGGRRSSLTALSGSNFDSFVSRSSTLVLVPSEWLLPVLTSTVFDFCAAVSSLSVCGIFSSDRLVEL